ncbi:MAG: HK97 family phage prohead protease [Myxococcaceae bacterium]|nr:HK97 family phage prohead protease [Myxococcaceae bacterium]
MASRKLLASGQVVVRKASFTGSSVDAEKRTAEVVWTTGAKVLRTGWDGNYYEELSLDPAHVQLERLNSGTAPLLVNHDGSDVNNVIGVVERAWLDGDKGLARVRFASDPEAEKIFQRVAEGIIKNVSVGYRVDEWEDLGGDPPTLRAVSWMPMEISAVSMGADAEAHFRSNIRKENKMSDIVGNEKARVDGILKAVKTARLEDGLAQEMIRAGTLGLIRSRRHG